MREPTRRVLICGLVVAAALQACTKSALRVEPNQDVAGRLDRFLSPGRSSDVRAAPADNPFLMHGSFHAITHWNTAATDTTKRWAWTGDHALSADAVQWQPMAPSHTDAFHRPYPGDGHGLYVTGADRVCKFDISGDALDLVNCAKLPAVEELVDPDPAALQTLRATLRDAADEDARLEALATWREARPVDTPLLLPGWHAVLDRDGGLFAGWGRTLYRFADDGEGPRAPLTRTASVDLDALVADEVEAPAPADGAPPPDPLLGVTLTHDGHLVVTLPDTLVVLDRDLTQVARLPLQDETFEGTPAIDPEGGLYVPTSTHLRKVVWTGSALSIDEADGAWAAPLPVPSARGHHGWGPGTTPALMGFGPGEHHLVLLPVPGEPASIAVYWRDEVPSAGELDVAGDRLAAALTLDFDAPAFVGGSPLVQGHDALLLAAGWSSPVTTEAGLDVQASALVAGVSRPAPRGAQKVHWDPATRTLQKAWTLDRPLQWALHPISTSTDTVNLAEVDGGVLRLVAVDWDSGELHGTTTLGADPILRGMGGQFIPMDDGDLLLTGWLGPVRLQMPGNGSSTQEDP